MTTPDTARRTFIKQMTGTTAGDARRTFKVGVIGTGGRSRGAMDNLRDNMPFSLFIVAIALIATTSLAKAEQQIEQPPHVTFQYSQVTGIGEEPGVTRRDPSDVIRVGETYYVYYSKVVLSDVPGEYRRLYPSGYIATLWYATSEDVGHTWTEGGEALGVGDEGSFDDFAIFTPTILFHDGRYWLYYTAVQAPFEDRLITQQRLNDPTAIGVAVADSPDGPFRRISNDPVVVPGTEEDDFDSYRVDDARMLIRDGKVWLYYKGRSLIHGSGGPRRTQMGVAIADNPQGPFTKANEGRPVQDSGHEVQIWRYGQGVLSLVSNTGPNGRTLQYAPDGLGFEVLVRNLERQPAAPGLYRPELTDPTAAIDLQNAWGISMGRRSSDVFLQRFEMEIPEQLLPSIE